MRRPPTEAEAEAYRRERDAQAAAKIIASMDFALHGHRKDPPGQTHDYEVLER